MLLWISPDIALFARISERSSGKIELVTRDAVVSGYQTYLVEQWCGRLWDGRVESLIAARRRVPDRARLFKTVTAYTGDKRHLVCYFHCIFRMGIMLIVIVCRSKWQSYGIRTPRFRS